MFAQDDSAVAVCAEDGYAGRWSLPDYKCVQESIQDETGLTSFHGVDFFPAIEEQLDGVKQQKMIKDKYQLVLAGSVHDPSTEKDLSLSIANDAYDHTSKILRVLGKDDEEKQALFDEELFAIGEYTSVKHILLSQSDKNHNETEGFVAGTHAGFLATYATSGKYKKVIERLPLH